MQRITALWQASPLRLVGALFALSLAAMMAVASGASFTSTFIALGSPQARFLLLALPALLIAIAMLGRLWREGGELVAGRGAA